MNKNKRIFFLLLAAFLLLSCGPFTIVPADTGISNNDSNSDSQHVIDQAIAATHAVETQIQYAIVQTMAAQGAQGAQGNQGANQQAPTITLTVSTKVMVSVSTATYCRMGPTEAYPLIGILYVGQTAEAIGRNSYGDSLVIRLPEITSTTCWLWTGYATITGDKNSLPVMTPPPVPATLTPTTPSQIKLSIQNNCGQNILYVYFTLSSVGIWGDDRLGADTLNIGETFWWMIEPGTYDVKVELSSHIVQKIWWGISLTSDTLLVIPP